jgi:hypothetical protein
VEARAELSSCHAANREATAEVGSLSVEATVAEALSGLATIYLAAESFFRPIWGRYFTTEYPPDRSTPSLPRLSFMYFIIYIYIFFLYQIDGLAPERGAGGGACMLGEGAGYPAGLRHLQLVRTPGTPG